jgi:hypothetical protein
MSSKAELLRKVLHRPGILAITILCTSVWWMSLDTFAQEAVPAASNMAAHSSLWSLEGPVRNAAPYLVIGMAERGDPLSYGLLPFPRDEAANPSPRDKISRPAGPVTSENRDKKDESGPLLLSRLFVPIAGARGSTDILVQGIIRRQTIQNSPHQTGTKVYSLLDDGPAPRAFLYGYRLSYLPPKQWLADNASFTHEVGQAPRPLLQLQFSNWILLVMLSGAAGSR